MEQFPPSPASEQPQGSSGAPAAAAPAADTTTAPAADPVKAAQEAQQAAEQRAQQAEQQLAQTQAEQAQRAAEQRERQAEQQLASIQTTAGAPAQAAAGGESPRRRYANWPQLGDSRPQPWDLTALGISKEQQDLPAGAPDTVSPVLIRHSMPIIASGYAGPEVAELARRLALLGISTDLVNGDNPFNVATTSIMDAVQRFREEYGVEEDPTPFGGRTPAAKERAGSLVGPYTWEALIRASDRAEAAQDAQEAA